MEKIDNIATLLGEDNVQKLRDRITELLLNTIENDLDSMCDYLIDFQGLFEDVADEVFKISKDKMVKKYSDEIEKKFDELFQKIR